MTVVEKTLTRVEAADLFRVQSSTVDRLITSGRLHGNADGVTLTALREFLTGSAQDAEATAALEDVFLGHWELGAMDVVRGGYEPGALKALAAELERQATQAEDPATAQHLWEKAQDARFRNREG